MKVVPRRHNVIVFALVLLLALTVCQVSAWSAHRKPKHLSGFHLVKSLPKTMVAGSTYEMTVDFRNPKRETFRMDVTLEVTEEQFLMGSGEFFVTGTLYAWETTPPKEYCNDLTFEEVNVGVFNSTGLVRGKTHNRLALRISSVPNLMPDTYTFTLTVTLQYEGSARAARSIKEEALSELEATKLLTPDKHTLKKINKAIKHIQKSLDPDLWVDDSALDVKRGHKVFDEEKKAVKPLMKILKAKKEHQAVKDRVQAAIDKLMTADELLADTVINDAKALGSTDPKVIYEIEKAEKKLTNAKEKIVKERYDRAVDHFKKEWKHAQHAIKKAG